MARYRGGDTRNWLHTAKPILARDSIGRPFWKCADCVRRVHERTYRGASTWVHTAQRRRRTR